MGINADILIDIDGNSWEESDGEQDTGAELTITIEFPEKHQVRTFVFKGTIGAETHSAWAVSCQHERNTAL